ncbi:MAG: DoxX family membrane protein [Opitutaceae bacterium]|nr:DoxX family membrane protein [Opitutaceae bacterium]
MNDHTSSPSPRSDLTSAFLLLRLFLGLRTLLAGLEKFEANKSFSFSNYSENMGRIAKAIADYSIIPAWATNIFAMSLGFLLVIFGAAILLGIKTRASLFLGGLVYVGLGFGLMAVQEGEGVAWIGMQVLMFAVALTLVRHNRFALVADKHCG